MCAPKLASIISASRSIESIFAKNGADVSFKGIEYEKMFYKMLDKYDIKFINMNKKHGKQIYQLDAAILVKDELILIELKCRNKNHSINKYIENLENINGDINQVNRIYNFFLNNLEFLEKEFNKKYNSSFDLEKLKKKKMIVYNNYQGESYENNNIILTDIDSICDFIRNPIGTSEGKRLSHYILQNYRFHAMSQYYSFKNINLL